MIQSGNIEREKRMANRTTMVISFVGTVLVLSVIGIVALTWGDNPIPDVLQNIAVGSLTGLVGLLVPARSEQ